MKNVVVVGAGVSGLQSALTLLEAHKESISVTIIAKSIPGETNAHYASPYAGANWMSFATPEDKYTQELDKGAYFRFLEYAKNEPQSAIHRVKNITYYRQSQVKNGVVPLPWYKDFVEGSRLLEKHELIDDGEEDKIVAGYEYDSVTITTTLYLVWLLNKVEALGGKLLRKSIKHINQAYHLHHTGNKADLVINCTGLLASKLGGVEDKNVHPARGQIVRVRNSFPKQIVTSVPQYLDETFYAFPRKEGGGIIGGTYIKNNWSTVVDPELSKRIIARAKKLIPELTDSKYGNDQEIDIIDEYVGLRPARTGGVRIERVGSVIHNYGIGGAGYQASIGLADKVLQLTNEFFRESKL